MLPKVTRDFVNFNPCLCKVKMDRLAMFFWAQIATIEPNVYLADSDFHLTILSNVKLLFATALKTINTVDAREREQG